MQLQTLDDKIRAAARKHYMRDLENRLVRLQEILKLNINERFTVHYSTRVGNNFIEGETYFTVEKVLEQVKAKWIAAELSVFEQQWVDKFLDDHNQIVRQIMED